MDVLKLSKLYWRLMGISKWPFSSLYANIMIRTIQIICIVCCLIISILTTLGFFIFEAKELCKISDIFVLSLRHAVMLLWYCVLRNGWIICIMNRIAVTLYTLPIIGSSFLKYFTSSHSTNSFRLVYPTS